jgi:hypothetical protein
MENVPDETITQAVADKYEEAWGVADLTVALGRQ